jgi:protease-4
MRRRSRGSRWIVALALAAVGVFLALRHLANQAALPFQAPAVGVVDVRGVIADAEDVVAALKQFRKSDGVAAVVLRVESPGGAVAPAQEIHSELTRLRETKPVVASLGNLAASGGYYIASACKPIVANPGTLTGSIGVIMAVRNVEDLMRWAGVKETVIKSGPYKDIANPLRSLEPEEQEILQRMVDDVHSQFVAAVAGSRSMPEAMVRELADGRLYSGAQAHDVGLVDELGGFDDAVTIAARAAGIEGEPRTVRMSTQRFWWLDWLGGMIGAAARRWASADLPEGLLYLYLGRGVELQ